jgi:hypothetical protein
VSGELIVVQLRSGRTISVDLTNAVNQFLSVIPIVGENVEVTGTFAPDGSLFGEYHAAGESTGDMGAGQVVTIRADWHVVCWRSGLRALSGAANLCPGGRGPHGNAGRTPCPHPPQQGCTTACSRITVRRRQRARHISVAETA